MAIKLADVKLVVGAKTSSSGKIFGSVNTIQISEALKEKGLILTAKASLFLKIRLRKSVTIKLWSNCTGMSGLMSNLR